MNYLKTLLIIVFVWMMYIVISTSNESNLFTLFSAWGDCAKQDPFPWFRATLWDFYANVLFIYLWLLYKENSFLWSLPWLLLLVVMGSPGTAVYIMVRAFQLKPGEGMKELLVKQIR